MASDKAMASALKRKRGPVEAAEPQKRAKSIGNDQVPSPKLDLGKVGWDAAFGRHQKQNKLVPENGASGNLSAVVRNSGSSEAEDYQGLFEQHQAAKSQKQSRKGCVLPSQDSTWNISEPVGGRIIDVDPVFTEDEKFLIIARKAIIQVYSTSNSLLNRSIKFSFSPSQTLDANIVAYDLSPTEPNIIWIACSNGFVYKVDWTSGEGSERPLRASHGGISNMAVTAINSAQRRRDILFTAGKHDKGWAISAHELVVGKSPTIESRTIYKSAQAIQILTANDEGTVVIAASQEKVLLGAIHDINFDLIDKIRYEFRIFKSPDFISSIDVRVSKRNKPLHREASKMHTVDVVDVLVGDVKGVIYVHNDLLGNLMQSQNPSADGQHPISLTPRKLHWHRELVQAAKWSLDGNYIISGGSETVLVLWQLDTNRKQFLPHLAATVKNIVVSPNGTSYAVHLADNSTMILSTSELKPTANISGIQAHVLGTGSAVEARIWRVKDTVQGRPAFPRTQAIVNPATPRWLLLAVGGEQELDLSSVASSGAPFLQTFDIASNHNVSRQAMTRNNVTNKNVGPGVHRISEPVISHIQISHDGSWLATVDEWIPPRYDVEFLGHGGMSRHDEQRRRREVYLKFWQWNKSGEAWGLVSRIDAPHDMAAEIHGAGRVLALIADPSSLTFSTLGEDGLVKIWRPRMRKRDGVIVCGPDGEALCNWTCHLSVSLGANELEDDAVSDASRIPTHGCLACSEDGSVFAAALTGRDDGLVHFIDPFAGTIRYSCPRLYKGDLTGMAFLGPNLVTVSNELRVYDLVLDEHKYGITLSDARSQLSLREKAEMIHLAVDRTSGTFAVTLPCQGGSHGAKDTSPHLTTYSELAVFDPSDPVPLYMKSLMTLVTALLPAVSSAGFLILDAAAEITTVSPKATQTLTSLAKPMVDLRIDVRGSHEHTEAVVADEPMIDLMKVVQGVDADDEDEVGELEKGLVVMVGEQERADDDDGPKVVSRDKLKEVLDIGPSFALPSVEEMFYRVMDLFDDKPRPRPVGTV